MPPRRLALDALWADLPILTQASQGFAAQIAIASVRYLRQSRSSTSLFDAPGTPGSWKLRTGRFSCDTGPALRPRT
jgi:hypothetical protein